MRIALLTDGIWPFVIGGMQKHSFYLCKYLARHGVEVDLYHTTRNHVEPGLAGCFELHELQFIHSYYVEYPASDRWPGHYLRASYAYSSRVYDKFLSNPMPDIIYVKGLSGMRLLEQKALGERFSPVFLNVHGYEYYQKAAGIKEKLQQFMLRPAFRKVNRQTDYIFSYGGRISEIIRSHIPDSDAKIVEIPTGIEEDFLVEAAGQNHEPRQFVFLGRFERRKGVQELLAALKTLEGKYSFHFHFIGDIPESHRPAGTYYTFHGRLSNRESIRNVLINAELLVCPSYAEGMPNVILEGMACGCAIIGTDVGAVPIEVDQSNGWLVPPGSVVGLRDAIVHAILMPDGALMEKRLASIRKVKQKFLWDIIIADVIGAFERVLEEGKSKTSEQAS